MKGEESDDPKTKLFKSILIVLMTDHFGHLDPYITPKPEILNTCSYVFRASYPLHTLKLELLNGCGFILIPLWP